MKIITQIGIVFAVCLVGEGISVILPFPFPASVISMILLFLLLCTGLLKERHIHEKANFLRGNMAFFFVPASVGILQYLDILSEVIFPLFIICLITTPLVYGATALSVKLTMRLMKIEKKVQHE